ncbi:FUSC family protein [Bacillus niameyensis]|uniref:FUSC family protein n=1 Tax=Bacillus niameyensis TaxID=1522308 RepID=UPI00078245ED|nr:aromatic acid exporter family protein [Bacillus niameyensis]
MKLGARMLKTGIAIIFALLIAELLHIPTPAFVGIAAIFAIQPTIYRSYLTVIEQIQGNILGAILAISFVLAFGNHILVIGLAAIIAIGIMVKFNLENAIRLALVTIVAVMAAPTEDFLNVALIRSSSILIGILSSFIVNLIFLPPKYETKLFHNISEVTENIIKWMRLSTRFASETGPLKKDLGNIKERITEINTLYAMFKEERRYFRKKEYAKIRKLVIYRQMIQVAQKGFDILKLQKQYENVLHQLPESLQNHTRNRLDFLLSYHEQLLMKFMGRVRQEVELVAFNYEEIEKDQLLDAFLKEVKKSDDVDEYQPYHLIHFLSLMIQYEEQLEHLEKLIRSLWKYHEKDLKVQ